MIEPIQDGVVHNDSVVHEFYRNTTVLITGGTGFIGKVMVEKLLRSFSIKTIYLLIRSKNTLSVNARLEEFFKESIFDRIRSEMPHVFDKVRPIDTNFDAPDLGIKNECRMQLEDEVQIIFNIVASVKFNEKLRDAIEINVVGTKKILNLAMGMKQLKSFLHISTLYSNCNRKVIEEKVYEQEFGYEKVVELTRVLDDRSLEQITQRLVGEMPNTYTMTKRCSEGLVNHRAHCLPAGIFRPPIVLSTYKEPVPGWTDNLYGPSGLCVGTARGFVHAIYGNSKKKANLVPADYCVNAMIASAWDTHQRFSTRMKLHSEIPVYNYIYADNNLTWGRYMELVKYGLHEPFDKTLWYFSYVIIRNRMVYNLANLMCHTIPGYLLDGLALVSGRKRIYTKGYQKLCRLINMMSYFGLRDWSINNRNVSGLSKVLQDHGNCGLPFDMATIDWNEYFLSYLPGIKKYFFKESESNSELNRKHYERLRMLHVAMKTSFWTCFYSSSLVLLWKFLLLLLMK